MLSPLLTQREAASILSISVRSLEPMRVTGLGPRFIKAGKSVRGPGGVKSPVSTSPSIGAPRLSITSVVVAGLLLPSVVGTQAATSCHQKKR